MEMKQRAEKSCSDFENQYEKQCKLHDARATRRD